MAAKSVSIWLDPEGDFLEVIFDRSRPGYFRETKDDRVMEKLDDQGNVIGFSILKVSSMKSPSPIEFLLN
ncbi:DUF2283 domain-containing protein [cyanobacterium TDX16]|nr:DUF2283 domain-containing protein [cyanobacterium TDX16]